MHTIDLSGVWRYETDSENIGYTQEFYKRKLKNTGFALPGSACENEVGEKQEYFTELTRENVRCLRPRYSYIGALWLQREITVPESFVGKHITLFLERVNIASELWIDGKKIGRQIIGLSTPHIFELTDALTVGNHTLTL
ncbi:MAG: glycoside hydrolase family 2, partial [Oscillospiraceae bacterium]|nr:glycoside hydrolase family 2 [Oscillospiraceae bacterium]